MSQDKTGALNLKQAPGYYLFKILGCYGFSHALVDATCAATVLGISGLYGYKLEDIAWLILMYNIITFGTQPLTGIISDHFKSPVFIAITGCLITALGAVIVYIQPIIAVILVGAGNSLFHVGGGTISLNLTPDRTTAPGIFVAPGALGLCIGILIGKGGHFIAWPFVILLILFSMIMLLIKIPDINYEKKKFSLTNGLFELILLLILFSISIRALIALSLTLPWKADITLLLILTMSVVLGKIAGGLLADKFGWMRVSITALIISAPLLAFGHKLPFIAITGAFLFQLTMPVTLVAIATMFKGRPGFAFGLPCLALIIGAFPSFTDIKYLYLNSWIILLTILCSLTALFIALWLYFKYNLNTKEQKV
ncbi:MAG: hypothetical protein AB1782_02875 [Cyanobacteriota bacterium]